MLEFLTRQSLSLIVFSYALMVVLLIDQLHIALIILGLVCALWRIAVFTGRMSNLKKLTTNILVVICSLMIVGLVYPLGVLQVLINLIVLGFSLKFLELKSVRDVHFFVNTGFMLIALFLIFNQSILMASAAAFAVICLLTVLLSIHGKVLAIKHQYKLLSKVLLLSLPLAVILFLILPRLPSMWKMPLQKHATTGLSDSVTPGSIAELTKSPALAFRVSFNGELPTEQDRYWRVLTLDQFNGKTWSQSKSLKQEERQVKVGKGKGYDLFDKENSYQLILEPHYKHYLPSLDFAESRNVKSVLLSDYSLRSVKPVFKRQAFEINQYNKFKEKSDASTSLDASMPINLHNKYTALPDATNPQTRRWLEKQLASGLDKYTILDQLLARFYQDNFSYTLQPPLLGKEQVDDFLFSSQAGFCVHYASTYLFVARALNVPSRMVTGYLGGEWDASSEFLTVRQYDAHAWVEIWKNNHWERVDPTAYVAPERVEQGIIQSLDDQSEFLSGQYFSIHRWQNNALLNELRSTLAKMDYLWAVWVINYDSAKQFSFLQNLLKNLPWLNLSMAILLLLFLVTTIMMLWVFKPWKQEKLLIEDKIFNKMYQKAGKKRLVRNKGQTVADYCEALSQQNTSAQPLLLEFGSLYNQIKYRVNLSSIEKNKLTKQLLHLRETVTKHLKV